MTAVYYYSGMMALLSAYVIIRNLAAFRKVDQTQKVMCGWRVCVWAVMLYLASITAWRVHSLGDTDAAVSYIVWLAIGQWPAIVVSMFGYGERRRS